MGDDNRVMPFDENREIIKVSGGTDFGFAKSHTTKSETKSMYETMDNKIKKKKELAK